MFEGDSLDTSEYGLVLQISKTGHDTISAQVLFNDGDTWWIDSEKLEVASEGYKA